MGTADAEDTLQQFDADKVYIIGGIVDHNRLKGKTKLKADEQGICSMKLPLGEHIQMGAYSHVLAVNHVLSIIIEHQHSRNWREALEKSIPGRKVWTESSDTAPDASVAADPNAQPDHGDEKLGETLVAA